MLRTSLVELLASLRRPLQQSLVALTSAEGQAAALAEPELLDALAQEAALLAARLSELAPRAEKDAAAPLVVVVDDERRTLDALRELLSPAFEVLTSTDPHQALAMIRSRHPDAVVTDLRMPEMNGHSLLRVLRGDQTTADIPCLVVSASEEVRDKVTALEHGAVDFLTKPVDPDELAARIRSAILRARTLRQERAAGETDELTGLPNRRAFRAFIERALAQAEAVGEPLTLAVIDQDRLKQLNDTFGHPAGDAGIRAVAAALTARKRARDLVARVGGDEFVVVLPGTDAAGARAFLNDVAARLAQVSFHPAVPTLRVRFSYGLATRGEDGNAESWQHLFARADEALYRAKRTVHAEQPGPSPSGALGSTADAPPGPAGGPPAGLPAEAAPAVPGAGGEGHQAPA